MDFQTGVTIALGALAAVWAGLFYIVWRLR